MRMLLSATVGLLSLVAVSSATPASAASLDQQAVLAGFAAPSPAVQFGALATEQLTVANDESDARRRRRRTHRRSR